jgi:hypothetical protein
MSLRASGEPEVLFERRAINSLSPSSSVYLPLTRGKRKGGQIVDLPPGEGEFFLFVNRPG